MIRTVAAGLLFMTLAINLLLRPAPPATAAQKSSRFFRQKLALTVRQLRWMNAAIAAKQPPSIIRQRFIDARAAYKQVECLLEYYYPYLLRKINGPALPFADGENSYAILEPEGFQVIEEMVFSLAVNKDRKAFTKQVSSLIELLNSILHQQDPYNFQDPYIFDAMRFEVYRMIALGISGFDSQAALNSIAEADAVLESLQELLSYYLAGANDPSFETGLRKKMAHARNYLLQHNNFNEFDRLDFITRYADPISGDLLVLQQKLGLTLPQERRLLSTKAPHLFATGYYDPSGYSPNVQANSTAEKALLGRRLFFDTILSSNHRRSCASCHQPSLAFTDGLAKSMSLDNSRQVARNAPTLWNAAFQPKQFYDSRAVFLEGQVFEVVHNPDEMGGSLENALQRVKQDSSYRALFIKAYGNDEQAMSGENLANAIASFLRTLVSLNAPFDRYMNGDNNSLDEPAKKGFNLFMGKAKCATCHFVPFFNGVAPPYFREAESEVLGVPSTTDTIHATLDGDPGKFNLYPISILKFAFKTPTLRNVAVTAPYMHNGVFKTLEEVIDFYDRGGASGLGIAPTNQTLPAHRLSLTGNDKAALIAFLRSLTDTSGKWWH